jgi:hypothetical protein
MFVDLRRAAIYDELGWFFRGWGQAAAWGTWGALSGVIEKCLSFGTAVKLCG